MLVASDSALFFRDVIPSPERRRVEEGREQDDRRRGVQAGKCISLG